MPREYIERARAAELTKSIRGFFLEYPFNTVEDAISYK